MLLYLVLKFFYPPHGQWRWAATAVLPAIHGRPSHADLGRELLLGQAKLGPQIPDRFRHLGVFPFAHRTVSGGRHAVTLSRRPRHTTGDRANYRAASIAVKCFFRGILWVDWAWGMAEASGSGLGQGKGCQTTRRQGPFDWCVARRGNRHSACWT